MGEQALALLTKSGIYREARQPDLVVLDLNMPGVDGWAVLSQRQTDAILQKIPIVVLSTSRQPEDHRRALSLGANSYIVKPRDFQSLIETTRFICNEFLPPSAAGAARERGKILIKDRQFT
jgi:CheY-like chemotaxis protein